MLSPSNETPDDSGVDELLKPQLGGEPTKEIVREIDTAESMILDNPRETRNREDAALSRLFREKYGEKGLLWGLTEPTVDWRTETEFPPVVEYVVRDDTSDSVAEYHLSSPLRKLEMPREAKGELYQSVVEERKPRFDRMGHRNRIPVVEKPS